MQHRSSKPFFVLATAAVTAVACATQPQPVITTTSSSGEVAATTTSPGMWTDSAGGTWMDANGGFYRGRGGAAIGLGPTDVAAMSNANIVAHLATGDSLEIALSQAGAARAQNQAVRDFAQRMVTEHSQHMQMGQQMAAQAGIAPSPLPADTADVAMATNVMNRLSSAQAGANYDRQLMRAEVMMHQHMLHELNLVQPQSSGAARQLVDQTIPVVQQHLNDARRIWQQVGGGDNAGMRNGRGGRGTNGTNGTNGSNGSTPNGSPSSSPSSTNP
jgi:putative membrane protein